MQKIIKIYDPTDMDLSKFNDKELTDGWYVRQMTGVGDKLIILLEKETRKEKLDKIDEISSS